MAIKWNQDHGGKTEFEGAVLAFPVWHSNIGGGDYETRFCRVWDGQQVRDIDVGTVSYASSWPMADCGVDATPEVIALAAKWEAGKRACEYRFAEIVQKWRMATGLVRGNRVVVRSGRKIPIGTIGVIEATSTAYGPSVKINGTWTKGDNVHVLVSAIPAELNIVGERQTTPVTHAEIYASHRFEVAA